MMIYISFKNLIIEELLVSQVIFGDVIGCSVRVYKFTLLKSSHKVFYISSEQPSVFIENKNKIRTF